MAQVSINGNRIGQPLDFFAVTPQLSAEYSLGKMHLRGGDANRLRIETVGKSAMSAGYRLGLDYLRLGGIVVEDAIEAESLKILEQFEANACVQAMDGFGLDKWSASSQLFCPSQKGKFVVLEINVADAGQYALDIYFTKAADYGIVEVSLDGKKIGQPFDGYNNGVIPSGRVHYGSLDLTARTH